MIYSHDDLLAMAADVREVCAAEAVRKVFCGITPPCPRCEWNARIAEALRALTPAELLERAAEVARKRMR